ncbi:MULTISPECIES: hypothetical protein [unclassified Streptomyces]|uniref:hypothetical protein n=1 Tax=unclassified Streptomyces TaxID=2593676 RepID=UPI0036BBFCB8
MSSTPPATASAHGWWKCENRIKTQWRSVIDVDLIGIADSSEKAVTKTVTLSCGA